MLGGGGIKVQGDPQINAHHASSFSSLCHPLSASEAENC